MFVIGKRRILAMFGLCISFGLSACNVDGRWSMSRSAEVPARASTARPVSAGPGSGGVDLLVADAQEVDLVEDVVAARTRYHRTLRQLHGFYQTHGYSEKAEWADFELRGLLTVKQFRYLLDAEVPSGSLSPLEQIPAADAMFDKGLDLMRRGGRGVPGIYRQDRMVEAAEVFRQLIERYPTSDKIDDAAFYCGEIHKDYLPGQEPIAVKWYERAWTWNPRTPHPARFQAAVVYDYRLHERDRALELYQAVTKHETAFKGNVRFATRRIHELTDADGPARRTSG